MSLLNVSSRLGEDGKYVFENLPENERTRIANLLSRPDLSFYPASLGGDRRGWRISTPYGQIVTNYQLNRVDHVYVNQVKFGVTDPTVNGLETLLSKNPEANLIEEGMGSRRGGHRRNRTGNRSKGLLRRQAAIQDFESLQKMAYEDMASVKVTHETFFQELGAVLRGSTIELQDVYNDVVINKIQDDELAYFLTHDAKQHTEIVHALNGIPIDIKRPDYDFEPLKVDDSFAGKLLERLGEQEGQYDAKAGVLKIGDRYIQNIPYVDAKGIFHRGETDYIPYHVGYFTEGEGSRVDRLRCLDPVEQAVDAVVLHYKLTQGDVRFPALLDVSRNLTDFDHHPFGDEILDTLKRKVVIDKSYTETNSLLAAHYRQTDDLGTVATLMLDDDAKGLIDPYGTSNGKNMGLIFYLTQDAKFNPDGTLSKGEQTHSKVGDIMNQYGVDKDNFNRNQMSFNALLTSTDAKCLNVAYAEFGLWNSEDAVVLTKRGSEQFKSLDGTPMAVGDKIIDMHGNKSTSSLCLDPDMPEDVIKDKHLKYAIDFVKKNPEVDLIVSPVSLNSRLNMGVAKEGLMSQNKFDLQKPDGQVIPKAVTQILYLSLPQTAEHKSIDYSVEGQGRKYSTLFRQALASKVGLDLYEKGLIDPKVKQANIQDVNNRFERMGIYFEDTHQLIEAGNVKRGSRPGVLQINAEELEFKTAVNIRNQLMGQMKEANALGIDIVLPQKLGHQGMVKSPMSRQAIQNEQGQYVLPIRINEGESISYRYLDVFQQLSLGNVNRLQSAYMKAILPDYNAIVKKDNVLKHIDTSIFHEGAKTEMIVPDPSIKLGQIRTSVDCDRVIAHRDPCIQSGNVISFENIQGNSPNLTHINPLMVNQIDGDFDSDTMGINSYDNLNLSDTEKTEFFNKSSVYDQLNRYGDVFLSTGGSHFKAGILINDLDDSKITFENGESNQEVGERVEALTRQILDSPKSYGAYALSFADEQSLKNSMSRLAEDGIKGSTSDVLHHFESGYSDQENRAVMNALIAKSEWTGLGGSITNNFIAGSGDRAFDAELTRAGMDITYSMTQSVLQMKKNADKLPYIDACITEMKKVMSGKYDLQESHDRLLEITEGLAPQAAVDHFVNLVEAKGSDPQHFGRGLFNKTPMGTMQMAYTSEKAFVDTLNRVIDTPVEENQTLDTLADCLAELDQNLNYSMQ